jgi:hypothetical protein
MPILQLVLFGYAINTDPKHLPTAVVMADPGPFARALRGRHAATATTSRSSAAWTSAKPNASLLDAGRCSSS